MTQSSQELPVKLELFTELGKYASEHGSDDGINDLIASEILTFCQTFFQQFLRNVVRLEITGINDKAKEAAIRRRISLEKQQAPLPVRQLILMFQDLCDMWPDIVLGAYVHSESLFREFYASYIPQLLIQIHEWAQTGHFTELVEATSSAVIAFDALSSRL
jgi:hypothetical protein